MGAPYSGRCACGQVTLEISGEPVLVRQCWCHHCQQLAAGSATSNAIFKTADVTVHGHVTYNVHLADSGNELHWGFCPQCGSQMLAWSSAREHLRVVRLGALDRPHGLKPTQAIWLDEAPEWAVIDPLMEQWPQQPPAPQQAPPSK